MLNNSCHQKVTKFGSKFLEIIYVLMNKIKISLIYRGILKTLSAYIWHFGDLMFNYWYWKKMVEISVTAEISDEKKILWWHRMIGSFWFCFQNFPFRSLSFGIGLYLILINSPNRSTSMQKALLVSAILWWVGDCSSFN